MPKFSNTRNVQWEFCVDEVSNLKTTAYDMIIGTDLTSELNWYQSKISSSARFLSFSQMSISWEDLTIPMKEDGLMSDRDAAELSYILTTEAPILLKEAED